MTIGESVNLSSFFMFIMVCLHVCLCTRFLSGEYGDQNRTRVT